MALHVKVWDYVRRSRGEHGGDPRPVRPVPGAVARSPLELRVQEILAADPACGWDHLVARVADYLRGNEDPGVLASLDEGVWGGRVWPALARKELRSLEGILLEIEASFPPADTRMAAPAQQPAAPTAV